MTLALENSYQNGGKRFVTLLVTGVQASGTDRGFLVFVWGGGKNGGETITSCTWDLGGANEVVLTQLTDYNNGLANVAVFHAQGDGTINAATATMTIAAANQFSWTGGGAIVMSLSGMDGTTGVENRTTGTTNSLSVTSSSGDWVSGIINELSASQTITPGTGDTEVQDVVDNDTHGVVNYDPSTGASESVDWNGPTATRAVIAVNIIAAAGAAAAGQTHQMML